MTETEQRIAIAEACGWIFPQCLHGIPAFDNGEYGCPPHKAHTAKVPDYLNDLNAMHCAEDYISSAEQKVDYTIELAKLLDWYSPSCPYPLLHATAAQRAEAFLRTIGKLKDEPPAQSK